MSLSTRDSATTGATEPDVPDPIASPGAPQWAKRPHLTTRLALVATVLVAAGLRLWNLGLTGLNSDEAVYAAQAAGIAGNPDLQPYFPVFRAHPMLFQTLLSVFFLDGVDDLTGRVLAALFGVATVVVVYLLGKLLYDRRVGLLAAALVALMPYHVVVSRQLLLDAPMAFFATFALYCVARYCTGQRQSWLLAGGAVMGLTLLTKETGGVLLGGLYAFFALSPKIRLRVSAALSAVGLMAALVVADPLALGLAGRSGVGQSYLLWQLTRRPNHPWSFYFTTVPPKLGWLVVGAAVVGLIVLRRQAGWAERLLLCWAAVPIVFFTLWPVKGFQYLLAVAPVVAVLAARAVLLIPVPRLIDKARPAAAPILRLATAIVICASIAVPSLLGVAKAPSTVGLAGGGGLPGGREAGHWIATQLPDGAVLLTIGPSMANVLKFYGHRRAYGLSVSPNPLNRNPAYHPVENPDRDLRRGDIQYIVWDAYSAARAPGFAAKLLGYASRYHAVQIHAEQVTTDTKAGPVRTPVITIYRVEL
jgi:4-amino-4-deoxy-L-arabinose transferase-like glycosyltransferase